MRRRGQLIQSLLLCVVATSIARTAMAQSNDVGRLDRRLEQLRRDQYLRIDQAISADRRALVDYGAYGTVSYLSLDDLNHDNHVLRQYEIVGYGRVNIDHVHEFFLRGHVGYQDFGDQDSFDGQGDEIIEPDFEAAYYKFDLRRALEAYQGNESDVNLTLEAGRDLVYWGNGLVLSATLDGVMAHLDTPVADVDVIAGITPVRTVDFDSSRPSYDHNTRRGFYGALVSKQIERHKPYAYGLIQRDYNKQDTLDFTDPAIHTRYRYDSFYLGLGSTGAITDKLLYGAELAYEGGRALSNSYAQTDTTITGIDQTDEDIHAFAADVRLDYLVGDERHTRLSAEGIYATGDSDRLTSTTDTFGGNRPGGADHSFNAFGFINTGIAYAPSVSNLIALRLGISTFPLPRAGLFDRLQIGADAFVFGKADKDAPMEETAIAGERYLGWEPDLFLNWQITSDVTIAMRYGIFFPGNGLASDEKNRQFFFVGVTYAF